MKDITDISCALYYFGDLASPCCLVFHNIALSSVQGFTEEEGKELLSKYTNQPVSKLPPEANKIIKLSHGSPLVLDIIGE